MKTSLAIAALLAATSITSLSAQGVVTQDVDVDISRAEARQAREQRMAESAARGPENNAGSAVINEQRSEARQDRIEARQERRAERIEQSQQPQAPVYAQVVDPAPPMRAEMRQERMEARQDRIENRQERRADRFEQSQQPSSPVVAQAAEPSPPTRRGWSGESQDGGRNWRGENAQGREQARQGWRQNRGQVFGNGQVGQPPVFADQRQYRGTTQWGVDRNDAYRNNGYRNDVYRNERRYAYQNNGQFYGQANPYDPRYSYQNNRGLGWSRDWRRDRRYDWQNYRYANRGLYRADRYYAPYGWNNGYRRFSIGISLSSSLFGQRYWIDDPYSYRLPPAYGTYRWVRYYDDVLLVDLRTGQVVDAIYDFFW